MSRKIVAPYRPGETFACVKRPILGETFDPVKGWTTQQGEPCGTEIVIHGYHWCAQVCPKCLANYHTGWGTNTNLYLDTAGFYPADVAERVRATIAANGGQYVPQF